MKKNRLGKKYDIYFKSLLYLVYILIFSYSTSFLIPKLGKYTNWSYQIYTIGLPAIIFSISLLFLLIYLLSKDKIKFYKWKVFSNELWLKKITIREATSAFCILILFLILQLLSNLVLKSFGVVMSNDITLFKDAYSSLKMNKFAIYLYVAGLLLGAVVEELFWRGYLLPLQVKKLSNKAWLLNGSLWALSHIFAYNPLRILIEAIGFSYVAYRYKNIWFTIIFHLLINGYVVNKILNTFNY